MFHYLREISFGRTCPPRPASRNRLRKNGDAPSWETNAKPARILAPSLSGPQVRPPSRQGSVKTKTTATPYIGRGFVRTDLTSHPDAAAASPRVSRVKLVNY